MLESKGRLSYLLKYQLSCRISIILYRYTYRIEKIDRYPALGDGKNKFAWRGVQCMFTKSCWLENLLL